MYLLWVSRTVHLADTHLRRLDSAGRGPGGCTYGMAGTERVRRYDCSLCTLSRSFWSGCSRKLGKKLSFFGIRDSFGTTQLLVDARVCGAESLAAMRDVPEESTVLVRGVVSPRPESQRRSVRSNANNPGLILK